MTVAFIEGMFKMSIDAVSKVKNKVVGVKQVLKALERKQAECVFIATDVDERIVEPILFLCKEQNVPLKQEVTKQELGKACGIQVGATAVGLLK